MPAIVITPEMFLYAWLILEPVIRRTFSEYEEMTPEERAAKIKELEAEKAELDAGLHAVIEGKR